MLAKISIIMGVYNCADTLGKCIDSIISQTYTDWELIMCDDGSSDNTYYIAEEYRNKMPTRIILLKNNINLGLQKTLNKCLSYVNSEFVARQDGDDYSLPNRLEIELSQLERNPQYTFVSCGMIFADRDGEWGKSHIIEFPEKNDFVKGSPFCHAPVLIRTKALKDVGGYDEDEEYNRIEDFCLWTKLYKNGYKGFNIQEYLYVMIDDRNAIARRTRRSRYTSLKASIKCYKTLQIPKILYIKPIIIAIIKIILPFKIYEIFHRKNLNSHM